MRKIYFLMIIVSHVIASDDLQSIYSAAGGVMSNEAIVEHCRKTMEEYQQDITNCDDLGTYHEILKQHPEWQKPLQSPN